MCRDKPSGEKLKNCEEGRLEKPLITAWGSYGDFQRSLKDPWRLSGLCFVRSRKVAIIVVLVLASMWGFLFWFDCCFQVKRGLK